MNKTETQILKTKNGKIVARAYPWDSEANRKWQLEKQEKATGERLQWQDGGEVETVSAV